MVEARPLRRRPDLEQHRASEAPSDEGPENTVDGGREIREPLAYGENSTFGWYQGYQPLAVAPTQTIDASIYSPKQCSVAVTLSGREMRMNRSDAELIDLLDTRMSNAEKSMMNQLSRGVYGDGTANGGNQLVGLKALVPKTMTTGTAGGIARAGNAWWRGITDTTALTASNIEEKFNTVWSQLCRNTDKPDLIIVDNVAWRFFVSVLQGRQRFMDNASKATEGFPATRYMTADVVMDGGQGGNAPQNVAYFLNTDFLKLKTYKGANMEPAPGGARYPVDQDAEVHHILWMGALCASNLSLQGRAGSGDTVQNLT